MTDVLGSLSFLDTPDVNGALVLTSASGVNSVAGTANQIAVAGTLPAYTVSLADNAILPGTASLTLPIGTTAQRPGTPLAGMIRYNSTTGLCEKYTGAYWGNFGLILQQVTGTIAAGSGTTIIPLDNTIPTSTEGWQIWTQTFTPISATSRIVIQATITSSHSAVTGTNIMTLFAGTTNIQSVATRTDSVANTANILSFNKVYAPGSVATITFSARLGNPTAGTSYCNQIGTTTLGGSLVSNYIITEVE
jgi:hypothetical protein